MIMLYSTQNTLHCHPCNALAEVWKDLCRMDRAMRTKLTRESETDCARDCIQLSNMFLLNLWSKSRQSRHVTHSTTSKTRTECKDVKFHIFCILFRFINSKLIPLRYYFCHSSPHYYFIPPFRTTKESTKYTHYRKISQKG
jgi:hypothetical protein